MPIASLTWLPTEQAVFTLTPFKQLANRGQMEIKEAAPERPLGL